MSIVSSWMVGRRPVYERHGFLGIFYRFSGIWININSAFRVWRFIQKEFCLLFMSDLRGHMNVLLLLLLLLARASYSMYFLLFGIWVHIRLRYFSFGRLVKLFTLLQLFAIIWIRLRWYHGVKKTSHLLTSTLRFLPLFFFRVLNRMLVHDSWELIHLLGEDFLLRWLLGYDICSSHWLSPFLLNLFHSFDLGWPRWSNWGTRLLVSGNFTSHHCISNLCLPWTLFGDLVLCLLSRMWHYWESLALHDAWLLLVDTFTKALGSVDLVFKLLILQLVLRRSLSGETWPLTIRIRILVFTQTLLVHGVSRDHTLMCRFLLLGCSKITPDWDLGVMLFYGRRPRVIYHLRDRNLLGGVRGLVHVHFGNQIFVFVLIE
jgi:hypothetical protein